LLDGDIVVAEPDANIQQAAVALMHKMLDADSELVTIIYGADLTNEAAELLEAAVLEIDEDLEVEIHDGGQPLYPFLISVE
jgi:dihydroxyacetone kinase-like predicted kinase